MEGCMRIFIAITLSREAREELRALQSSLKASGADVRWVDPENIHLTLRFLGDCGERTVPLVESALSGAVSDFRQFHLGLEGIGAFTGLSSPKVIWAGVGEGARESGALCDSISSRLAEAGIPGEERKFLPHITVGRVRSGKNIDSLRKAIEGTVFSVSSRTLVDRVVLFSSKLSPEGPIYTPLSEAMLRRP